MVAALPPTPDGTCVRDIATDMADVMLSTVAELAPGSKRRRGAPGQCAGHGVEAEISAAKHKERRREGACDAECHNTNLPKVVKIAGKNIRKVRKVAVLNFVWAFVYNSKQAFEKVISLASIRI